MPNISNSILEQIGNTPLVNLSRICKIAGAKANILAKIESFNPCGSVKDRIALEMIKDAFDKKLINEQSVLIEPTSGNTGIAIAAIGAVYGLRVILTMPDTMSMERRKLISAYGAEIVLSEGARGMKGAIEKANELAKNTVNAFVPSQFTNMSNPNAHKKTTAIEILRDTDGKVDILVCGVGTGGTITGVGTVLKEKIPGITIVAVEPASSPVLSGGAPGPHKIQGIGAGFIPEVLDTSVIDDIIKVSNEDAAKTARILGSSEGILCGISSGAALFAALSLAKLEENREKNIVVILPDTGERYLSTDLFNEQ